MKPLLFAVLAAGAAIPALGLFLRYRRDLNAARVRLAAVDRRVVSTRWGAVEYAERGSGDPVLVVPGIYQNCVSALFFVRDLFADRRFIAPSRFGYLGSSLPLNATPAAQADAFAALLDALDIGQIDVVGMSAGATSALQLALRHPEKVKHLAVLVGNLPGSPTTIVQPSWTKRVNRQFVMWALRTLAPSTTARLVSAVPRGFAMSSDDVRYVNEFIDSLFPMSPEGYNFDLFVSNPDVTSYNLEAISVPTLIAHTKDDQLALSRGESPRSGAHPRRSICQSRIGRASHARSNEDHPRRTRRFLCRADRSPYAERGIVRQRRLRITRRDASATPSLQSTHSQATASGLSG